MKKWLEGMICALLCCMHLFVCAIAETDGVQDALIFSKKNQGMCKRMLGDVQVLVVFADINDTLWTEEATRKQLQEMEQAAASLEEQAAAYGKELKFHFTRVQALSSALPDVANPEKWVEECLMKSDDFLKNALGIFGKENALTIFCIPGNGRSVAYADGWDYPEEYVITFNDEKAENYMHELLHLFGAQDYYYPDDYLLAANQYFPDSIMLDTKTGNTVDGLTAYLIGWTDAMDEKAVLFVQKTVHITDDDIKNALYGTLYTGYTRLETENSVYFGMLVDGKKDGEGVLQWKNGDRYTGEFKNDMLHGWGTYEWASGNRYCGQYENGKQSGSGTYFWTDGSRYTGDFSEGVFQGYGVQEYANGDMYMGEYVNNQKAGKGMHVWKDGSTYTGDFDRDQFHGTGVYRGVDGTVMEGEWMNGEYQEK